MLCYTDRRGVARLNIMNATLQDAGKWQDFFKIQT